MTALLEIKELTKRYRGRHGTLANDRISLEVGAGQIVGLLGHNGAGKTTLVMQLVGVLRPDSGTATLDGVDLIAHPDRARELISVQAQSNAPLTGMSPRTAINLVGRIRGLNKSEAKRRTSDLIERLDLGEWADRPAQKLSGGISRLTSMAMTCIVPGRLAIFDEPTNDVDPVRRQLLWQHLRYLATNGTAVLLVTHNVREAASVIDRVVLCDHGKVVQSGTTAELTHPLRDRLTLELELTAGSPVTSSSATGSPAAGSPLDLPPNFTLVHHTELRISVWLPAAQAVEAVQWAQNQIALGNVAEYSLTAASLEDIYIQLVGPKQPEHAAANAVANTADHIANKSGTR